MPEEYVFGAGVVRNHSLCLLMLEVISGYMTQTLALKSLGCAQGLAVDRPQVLLHCANCSCQYHC